MKTTIAVLCLMLAAAPLTFAQDKAKDADRKATAAEKSPKPEVPKGAQTASDKTKGSTQDAEISPKAEQTKKEPSEKQKKRSAQKAKKSDCNKQAKEGKMKGDERKKFMKECLSK